MCNIFDVYVHSGCYYSFEELMKKICQLFNKNLQSLAEVSSYRPWFKGIKDFFQIIWKNAL